MSYLMAHGWIEYNWILILNSPICKSTLLQSVDIFAMLSEIIWPSQTSDKFNGEWTSLAKSIILDTEQWAVHSTQSKATNQKTESKE